MAVDTSHDESIPTDPEACYETVASQEEIYLEATEEEVRAILISGDQDSSRAKVWEGKIEELELDWEEESFHDECEQ